MRAAYSDAWRGTTWSSSARASRGWPSRRTRRAPAARCWCSRSTSMPAAAWRRGRGPTASGSSSAAHTCYNSYGAFLELLEMIDAMGELQPRGKPVLRFLDGDRLLPGQNLGALLRRMSLGRLLLSLPRALWASPRGQSVALALRAPGGRAELPARPRADALGGAVAAGRRAARGDALQEAAAAQGRAEELSPCARGWGRSPPRWRAFPGSPSPPAAARPASSPAAWRPASARRRTSSPWPHLPAAAAALLSEVAPAAARAAGSVAEARVDDLGVVVRRDRVALPYASS
jgi:hypothetical protein